MYKRSGLCCTFPLYNTVLYCCCMLSSIPNLNESIWTHISGFALHFLSLSCSFSLLLSGYYYLGGIITVARKKDENCKFKYVTYRQFLFTPIMRGDHARWYHCASSFYVLFIHLANEGKHTHTHPLEIVLFFFIYIYQNLLLQIANCYQILHSFIAQATPDMLLTGEGKSDWIIRLHH